MGIELGMAIIGLITVIGGGGMWLGVLSNRVTNNTKDINKLVTAMNGHLKEFNTVVNQVARIEVTCDNILSKLNGQGPGADRIKVTKDGPEG